MSTLYRSLDAVKIAETVGTLRHRIDERFPESGLGRVAGELLDVAQEAVARSRWVGRPIWWLRLGVWALIVLMMVVLLGGLYQLRLPTQVRDFGDFFTPARTPLRRRVGR